MLVWQGRDSYIRWTDDSYGDLYMPVPTSPPQIRFAQNERISLSEAGTEIGDITRLNKKTFNITWLLGSDWIDQIEAKCDLATSTLVFGTRSPMQVRARLVSEQLVKGSEYLNRTSGVWQVTVQFTEV